MKEWTSFNPIKNDNDRVAFFFWTPSFGEIE